MIIETIINHRFFWFVISGQLASSTLWRINILKSPRVEGFLHVVEDIFPNWLRDKMILWDSLIVHEHMLWGLDCYQRLVCQDVHN